MSENLFNSEAFEQMPGQMSMDQCLEMGDPVKAVKLRKRTVFEPCFAHAEMYASERRERRAEVMVEGGWADSPCRGGRCRMRPGTDFFTADFVAANPVYTAAHPVYGGES